MIRIRAILAALAAALAAPLVMASPAAAVEPSPGDPVCNALTVEGVALLRTTSLAGIIQPFLPTGTSTSVSGSQIATARAKLSCGPAPADRTAGRVKADVCAALKVDVLVKVPDRIQGLPSNVRGVVAAVRPTALPAAVNAARKQLDCDGKSTPTASTKVQPGDPVKPVKPGTKLGGYDLDPAITVPVGAPETGAR